jgi:hypothetical protein
MPKQRFEHRFEVTISVKLPPEAVKRIAQAVQKSVLAELASSNLKAPLAINFLGDKGPQGIAVAER